MTIELIGPVLGVAATAGAVVRARSGPLIGAVAAVIAGAASLAPVGGDSLAGWVLAILGPASGAALTWFVLIGLWFAGRPALAGTLPWAAALLLVAAVLYPSAMGATTVDVYAFGFSGVAVPALLAVFAALAVWRGWWPFALHLLATGASALLGLHGSANGFDHMIDVPSVVMAAGVLVAAAIGRVRR